MRFHNFGVLRRAKHALATRCPRLAGEPLEERRMMAVVPLPGLPPFWDPSFRVTESEIPGYAFLDYATDVFAHPDQLSFTFSSVPSTAGGATGLNSATNLANWRLVRDDADISHLIESIEINGSQATLIFKQSLPAGVYQISLNDRVQDVGGATIRDDYADSSDAWRSPLFHVLPLIETAPPATITFEDGLYADHDVDASGNYVVLYTVSKGPNVDAYVQRFNSQGERQGEPILVDSDTTTNLFNLDVNSSGAFVVTWRRWLGETQATLFAKLFDNDGRPHGATVELDVGTGTNTQDIDVAMADDGSAVIVWQAREANGDGINWLQRISADGTLVAAPQLVGQGSQGRVAISSTGDFVIAWSSGYHSKPAVFVQRYDRFGNQLGSRIDIAGAVGSPSVAMDSAGNFAVLYETSFVVLYETSIDGQSRRALTIQRFTSAGQTHGSAIKVDTAKAAYGVSLAELKMDRSGRMVVQWREVFPVSSGFYQSPQEYVQLFDLDGTALGGSFGFAGFVALADNGTLISANRSPQSNRQPVPFDVDNFGSVEISEISEISDATISIARESLRERIEMRHFTWPGAVVVDLNGDPPGINIKRNFVPGGLPALLGDPDALQIHTKSETVASATITIEGYQVGDVLLTYSTNPKIHWGFNAGVLTLSGVDTVANYQSLLNDIWFSSTADRPAGSTVDIRVVVNDGEEESLPAYSYISIHVPGRSSIAGRQLFYNDSSFDSSDPTVTPADDAAIAPDKTPLLPGQAATKANYSSYSRGINGIMVDIAGEHGEITLDDFIFRVGNTDDPSSWAVAPTPRAIVVRPGAGIGGSDRVEIIWDDNVIANTWLQVIVLDNGDTGLAEPDIFYFGNRVGDTGNEASRARPQTFEALQIINRILDQSPNASEALIDDPLDFDRSGRIDSRDLLIIFNAILDQKGSLSMIEAPGGLDGMQGAIIIGGHIEFTLLEGTLLQTVALNPVEPLAAVFADWGDDEQDQSPAPLAVASLLMEEPELR